MIDAQQAIWFSLVGCALVAVGIICKDRGMKIAFIVCNIGALSAVAGLIALI